MKKKIKPKTKPAKKTVLPVPEKLPDKQSQSTAAADQAAPTVNHGPDHLKPYWWTPGQSGNPKGRPPKGRTLVSFHKELLDLPAPKPMVDAIARFLPAAWIKRGPITWAMVQVIRDRVKGTQIRYGDSMAKLNWEMCEGRATIRIAGAGEEPPVQFANIDYGKLSYDEMKTVRELLVKAAVQDAAKEEGD